MSQVETKFEVSRRNMLAVLTVALAVAAAYYFCYCQDTLAGAPTTKSMCASFQDRVMEQWHIATGLRSRNLYLVATKRTQLYKLF